MGEPPPIKPRMTDKPISRLMHNVLKVPLLPKADEGEEKRIGRLKRILLELERRELTFNDLLSACKCSRASLSRDLRLLEALELIEGASGAFRSMRNGKQKVLSKYEYDLAMEHTRKVLCTGMEDQRLDRIRDTPSATLGRLTFQQSEFPMLMDHLKTGYSDDIWALLERYRRLAEKYRLTFRLQGAKGEPRPIPPWQQDDFGPEPAIPEIPEAERLEIIDLQEKILGRFGLLLMQAEHGIPLKGNCKCCPTKQIRIGY